MAALTGDRPINMTAGVGRARVAKVAAGVLIFKGSVIVRNPAGFARPGGDVRGWRVLGIALERVDNTAGVDGSAEVRYQTAISIRLANDTTSPVTQAALGSLVYLKDDQTVQTASGNGVIAGVAEALGSDVLVYVASELSAAADESAPQVETVTAAVPLSPFAAVSLLSPTGTMAIPLPAGRFNGQRKLIRMIGGAATPIANVTGAFTTDGVATTQAQFNAASDQLEAIWNGLAWQVIANASVVLS